MIRAHGRLRGEPTPLRDIELKAYRLHTEGMTYPAIAKRLSVSVATVDKWMARVRAAKAKT